MATMSPFDRNVTVPVAQAGVTVAVKLTGCPTCARLGVTVKIVVVGATIAIV